MVLKWIWAQLKGAGRVAWAVWNVSSRTHMGLIAAGVAFYGFLALFPGMAAIIAIFGLISEPEVVQNELELLRDVIPGAAFDLIADQFTRLLTASGSTLRWATLVSFGVALWSARAGVSAVVQGLNAIYDIPDRSGIWHEILSLFMTIILMGVAVVAMLIVVVAPIVLALFPPYPIMGLALEGLRWLTAFAVLVGGLWMLYNYGPNRRPQGRIWMTPGAVAVVILWLVASWGLGYYLSNFGRYNEIYGSIFAVIALLLWLWVSAYLILAGAALNVVIERLRRRRRQAEG